MMLCDVFPNKKEDDDDTAIIPPPSVHTNPQALCPCPAMSSPYSDAPRDRRRKRPEKKDSHHPEGIAEQHSIASAPAEIQIAYEAEDAPLRHRRGRTAASSYSQASVDDGDEEEPPPVLSLSEQIAASALSRTIEFLKVAGGLTLNATGKVVAPPLHVTRTVLLPALWAASVDFLGHRTPKRVKDWLRILSSSVYHLVAVVQKTDKGQLFRQRLLILFGDIIDCLSADATRQVLVDGMAAFVKLTEALHTPETKAFLDQFTLLCCRLTQVAASGRSQQALHDTKTLVWSGVELLADPSSTTALAEVTAYLCHALEMEDAILDGSLGSNDTRAHRRKDRDDYQKASYQEKTTLVTDPQATVEQVILSSLGHAEDASLPGCEESQVGSDLPSSKPYWDSETGSLRKQVDEASSQDEDDEDWHERARRGVDVEFLQDRIADRARRLGRESIDRKVSIVTTGFDSTTTEASSTTEPPVQGEQGAAEGALGKDILVSPRKEGEDPLGQFYRILDSVLKDKRAEGVDHILAEYSESAENLLRDGKVHKWSDGKLDREPVTESIKSQLTTIRADLNKGLDRNDREKLKRMEAMIQKNSWVVYLGIGAVILFVLLWIAFGCYGLYVFVSPSAKAVVSQIHPPSPSYPQQQFPNEIVIRVVREVIHVDSEGSILTQRAPDQISLTQDRINEITECLSESL
jgi:hypothetical protein